MKEREYMSALRESNELLRVLYQVVKRKGADTNWDALEKKLKDNLEYQSKFKLHDK